MSTRRQFFVDSRIWNYGHFHDYFDIQTQDYDPSLNYTRLVVNSSVNEQKQHLMTTRTGRQTNIFW